MTPKMIQIKDSSILRWLMVCSFHPTLVEIIVWVAKTFGLCMTESWRQAYYDGDLHSTDPVQANDLRTWFYKKGMAVKVKEAINRRWVYDPKRPVKKCAIIHKNRNSEGRHFHIQVCRWTRLRRETDGRKS